MPPKDKTYKTTFKPKSEKNEFSYTYRSTEEKKPKPKVKLSKVRPGIGSSKSKRVAPKPVVKKKETTVRVSVPEKKGVTIIQKIKDPNPPRKRSFNKKLSSTTNTKARFKKSPKKLIKPGRVKCYRSPR